MGALEGLMWQKNDLYSSAIFEVTSVETTSIFSPPNTTINPTVPTVDINGAYTKTHQPVTVISLF